MNTEVFIDIETIPTSREDIRAKAVDDVSPPAAMKKEETIAKWWEENGASAREDAIHSLGLNGGSGEVFCIALAFGDGEVIDFARESIDEDGERKMLHAMNSAIGAFVDRTHKQPYFVGHNISGFDLRYIWQRMVVLGIRPQFYLPHDDAPWKGSYYDTMTAWAGARGRVSLENLCMYLGIETPKNDINGSKVWEYVKAGKHDEVREYCRKDVAATREVYKRMTFK